MPMRFLITIVLLASLTFVTATARPVFAAEPATSEATLTTTEQSPELAYTPQWPEPPDTGAMLLRLGLGTAAVLALSVGTLWFAKPWLQRLQVGAAGSSLLKIEGSVTLGSRAVLYLVKVGDTQLVAGTDPSGLKSLIVVPATFREVLDEQIPSEELGAQLERHVDLRTTGPDASRE